MKPAPPGEGYAKVEPGVVVIALVMIALLAAAVCVLHEENAVALRGTIRVADCEVIDEGVAHLLAGPEAQLLELNREEDARFVTYVGWLEERGELLRISGQLLRLAEPTREVRVRVGLIPGRYDEDEGAGSALSPSDEGMLLNTQMIRRNGLSQVYKHDDHCGFEAAVRLGELSEGTQYRVVLVEQTDAGTRLFETNCWALYKRDGVWLGYEREAREEGPTDE